MLCVFLFSDFYNFYASRLLSAVPLSSRPEEIMSCHSGTKDPEFWSVMIFPPHVVFAVVGQKVLAQ